MLIVDLSSNNGQPDFTRLAQHVQGAWIKATEGVGYRNPEYAAWTHEARAHGIRVGAYHFARPDRDVTAAAHDFCQMVGKPGRRDLRPVLDFETWDDNLTAKQHEAWARTFNHLVKKTIGVLPVFYSYGPFIQRMELHEPIGAALWLAAYGRDDGKEYPVSSPAPWPKVTVHQFTSRATVAGCPGLVDLSSARNVRPILAHPIFGLK